MTEKSKVWGGGFEAFRQQGGFLTRAKSRGALKYVLAHDGGGVYLEICDAKLKPLREIDFRIYSGVDREILRRYEEAQKARFFTIDWGEEESDRVYVRDMPGIMELLRHSGQAYLPDGTSLRFGEGIAEVVLRIQESKKGFKLSTEVGGAPYERFVEPDYALLKDGTLQRTLPIGEFFESLSHFDKTVPSERLEEMLTLLVSHFENVRILYDDYETVVQETPKTITPALVFDHVTADNELVLKTGAVLGKLAPDFFENFQITRLALLNEIERKIDIFECDFEAVFALYDEVYKTLTGLKRKSRQGGFDEEEGTFVIDAPLAQTFIHEHLQKFLEKAEIYGSAKLKHYGYVATKPTLNVAFKEKIDYLSPGDVTVSVGEESFDLFDFLDQYRKQAYIALKDGQKAVVDKEYIQRLERIFKKEKNKVKISFFDLPEIEEMIARKEQTVFKQSRAFYEGLTKLKSKKIRLPKLQGVQLRDYQKEGVKWLRYLYDHKFGGCLADDMGLGKTLQAIALLVSAASKTDKPSLVVMPKSLLSNWQNELRRFAPDLSFGLYYGMGRDATVFERHQVVLTSYGMVRSDIETLKEIAFNTVILDESQAIKNIDSKIAKAVMLLKADHRFALSGTPLENSLFELYSLFRFLNPGMFRSLGDFKRDYVVPIQSHANEEVAKALRARITPFVLRRLKSDVLKELPPKQEQVIYVDMHEAQRKLYEERRRYFKALLDKEIAASGLAQSRFLILQAFNELRQIASIPEAKSEGAVHSSKLDNLFAMLEEVVLSGHKVLIFANYLQAIDLIAQRAEAAGYGYLTMTGATKDRQALVDRFQNDRDIKLFLMTLKVGGVGLNLTSADYVFIFDPWWNKAAQNQAVDRAHRIGQKSTVFSYELIAKGTIEEKILQLQRQKQDLTDQILGGDEGGLRGLSEEDIDYILG